jgi:hypothetical protein
MLFSDLESSGYAEKPLNALLSYYEQQLDLGKGNLQDVLLKRATAFAVASGGQIRQGDTGTGLLNGAIGMLDVAGVLLSGNSWKETSEKMAKAMLIGGAVGALSSVSRTAGLQPEPLNLELYRQARDARNDVLRTFRQFPRKDIDSVATVVAGVSKTTGEVAVGTKWFGDGSFCAEDVVVSKLGGDLANIIMTPAVRPANLANIDVCCYCQLKFSPSNFGPGTTFHSN